MDNTVKSAIRQIAFAALAGAAFYLLAAAIFAVIVRAYAPSQAAVVTVNWILKALGAFVFSLIFVRKTRALVKGIISGIVGCIVSMLLFAAIGGGFHITAFFPLELLLMAVCGGLGAILGAKLRRDE